MTKFNMTEIVSLPLDRSPLRREAIAPRRFTATPGPAHARRKTPGVIDELVAIVTTMLS
jgi:hypothetical protein